MKVGFARSPAGLLVILAAALFVAEVIVMLLLAALPPMPPLLTNFLDATLLIVLAFPALRAFAFAPLLRQLRARAEAEEQLQEANRTLEAEKAWQVDTQAVAKVGSWETDFTTLAVTWSEQTHRIFETNPATFRPSHQAFLEFAHPDDRATVDEAFARSIGQPGTQAIEHRLLMPDGRVKFVEERWQSFSDDQGRPRRAIGTCQDISDRKRAEEVLRESEDRFRDLFENATDLIQIVSPDGHFLFVNRAWKKALGYTDEDRSHLTVLNIVDEGSKELCTAAFRRLMNGEDVPGIEAVFVGKHGQRIAVEGSVNCRRVDGKPGNTRGIFRNITESKRAEEALRGNRARLDLALRSADMGVWHWDIIENKRYFDDQVCHLLGINPATFTGAAEEFLGALHPGDRETIKALLARTVEQDVPYEPDYRAVWPDGSVHYITARGRLIRDDKGRPLRIIGIIWDVTARKRAEQALVHSQELLNLTGQMGKIGGWELDLETQTLSWSDEVYRIHEVDPATKLNVAEAINFYAPEARPVITAAVQAAIDSGTPWDLELPLITAQGQHIWVHAQGAAERRGGRTVRLCGAFQDITERQRTVEVLRASQQLIEGIINAIPVRVFWKDKNLVYLGCNAAFARDAGFADPKDIIGKVDYQMGWREQADLYRGDDRQILESGLSKLLIEEPQTTPEGNTITLLSSKLPLRNSKGEISGVLGTYMDITERKRAEAKLAEASGLLETMLKNSQDAIYFKDRASRFVRVSNAMHGLFGQTGPEMLLGKTDADFFSAEHAQPAYEDEQEIIRTGRPIVDRLEKETFPDGRVTWALTTKMPWRDGTGEIVGTFGISKNVTALKEAEDKLTYERDQLRALLDSSPDTIYFKDAQSRFVLVSRSKVQKALEHVPDLRARRTARGLPADVPEPELLTGLTDSDTYHDDDARLAYADEQQIVRTGEAIIGKLEKHIFLDAAVRWTLTSKMPWRDREGKIIGTFGISKDITALKETEEKLEQVHRQLLETSRQAGMAEVATSVLHNVGNVLNSVNVSATLVADHVRHSQAGNIAKLAALFDQHKADLTAFLTKDPRGRMIPGYFATLTESLATEQKTLITELEHLCKNIEHIKDVVAVQQSYAKTSGFIEMVPLAELVEDALRMNASSLARHDVELVRDFQIRPVISTDKHMIVQILVNLVRNAKFACDEAGRPDKRITVRIAGDAQRVRIAVSDNGVGIPAENLTRIFSHGFTTRKDGHGFGLHSGALAARELGGALSVQSEGPGHGATFILELPFKPDSPVHENPVR